MEQTPENESRPGPIGPGERGGISRRTLLKGGALAAAASAPDAHLETFLAWSYRHDQATRDPAAAVTLWEKMAKLGGKVPEFLSTHPSPENRAARLKALGEQMRPLYAAAAVPSSAPSFLAARDAGKPFCYWFGPTNVHRKWIKGSGKSLWGIDPDKLEGKPPYPSKPAAPAGVSLRHPYP